MGQGCALLLSSRQLVRKPVSQSGHINQFEHFARTRMACLDVRTLHFEAESDVIKNAQMRKQGVILKHHRRATSGGWQVRDIASAKCYRTVRHTFMTCNHAQR